MHPRLWSLIFGNLLLLVLLVYLFTGIAAATTAEKVVYRFLGPPDGLSPQASLVADSAGNLYGTTLSGGTGDATATGPGTVFKLSPPTASGGPWTETVLHNFNSPGTTGDGVLPYGTLLLDKQGNLYGTTEGGGAYGAGTVFEVSPPNSPGGDWIEAVLWSFQQSSTAALPYGKLVMDAEGNLYGTTSLGGTDHNAGAVFELVAPKTPGEPWSERVLYNLNPVYLATPGPDLLLRDGVIFGTGQIAPNGAVFELARQGDVWTATVLHSFNADGSEGVLPYGGLIADSAGNLYGTTVNGGDMTNCPPLGCGTVYELSPPAVAGDTWKLTTIHMFTKNGDGANPWGALWRDEAGNLYGTAYAGGLNGANLGTVYKLEPPAVAGGAWTFVLLHSFSGLPNDGANPHGGLFPHNGLLYGTAVNGGKKYLTARSGGAVFSIVP